MKFMVKRSFVLLVILNTLHVGAEDRLPTTSGELFERSQSVLLEPVLEYCVNEMPASKESFLKAYNGFKEKVAIAVKPVAEQAGPEWNEPVSADNASQTLTILTSMSSQTLPQIKQVGAENYCPMFAAKLENTTAEELAGKIAPSYENYKRNRSKLGVNFPSKTNE